MTTNNSDERPKRRAVLSAISVATGLSALTGSTSAQEVGDDQIITRPCDDSEFRRGEDWDCALTIHVCSNTEEVDVLVRSDGSVTDNRDALPQNESGSKYYTVNGGERFTAWFTGRLTRLDVSEGEYNMAITGRTSLDTARTARRLSTLSAPITSLSTTAGAAAIQERTEDQVVTRPCQDYELRRGENWDSALTTHVCERSEEITIRAQVGESVSRHRDALPENVGKSNSYTVSGGEQLTIWFNGRVERLDVTEGDYNMAIAGRTPLSE